MSVTIKDIATRLDLNFSSVSRALNNKPGVSEKTRKLVEKTAKDMGYQPNTLAKGLVSKNTNTIGVIMPDIINPVFGEITTGVIQTAKDHGYDTFICITNWDEKKEEEYLHTLLEKQVAGIIAKTVNNSFSKLFSSAEVPIVGFESWHGTQAFSSVESDNIMAGRLAGEHLKECGYKHPVLLPGPENSIAALQRSEGFFQSYNNIEDKSCKSMIFYGDYNIDSGYESFSHIIETHPETDAVMAGNDVIALGVLKYLNEHKIKEGKDIGVIGFDDITVSRLPNIDLTTVKQPKYSIGRIMTNLLLEEVDCINKGLSYYPQRILLEPSLIIRKTTRKKKNPAKS
ncbi:MAG: LacI family DNA-binding transcriptional regulator [Spirochaetales bacterium]|uniref:LacI family DNA-binding transcriptional regulator n=1 Tax=Candidatus Thalassospirochaeta sargassi TaxID=3119039 RepID=A0AAJ1MK67_9SPIO|nr:LacI family DNA-binding transcriptional regulator [Spirochaetales bacterium]